MDGSRECRKLFRHGRCHKADDCCDAISKIEGKSRDETTSFEPDLNHAAADRLHHSPGQPAGVPARSGIPNFTDAGRWDWFASQTDINQALALDQPADFAPDTRTSYSNINYLLIGRILDNVLGYSHQQYIAEEILAPLGLTHTYSLLSQVAYDDVVSGYRYEYDDDLRQLDHVIPGGSMIATAEDVGIFLRALNDGSLLNDDEQAIYSSIYEYEHTGWVPGYYSIARYYEDIDTVVVQFVSTTGGDTWGAANVVGGKATGISNIIYNRIVRILSR